MKVYFSQVYIEPGVRFPFSHHFQRRLSQEVTSLIEPSQEFLSKYGDDYKLVFNVSTKKSITENEIKGPTVFRRTKSVEYTVFLPFDVISRSSDNPRAALGYLLDGASWVLESLKMSTSQIASQRDNIIVDICADRSMFE